MIWEESSSWARWHSCYPSFIAQGRGDTSSRPAWTTEWGQAQMTVQWVPVKMKRQSRDRVLGQHPWDLAPRPQGGICHFSPSWVWMMNRNPVAVWLIPMGKSTLLSKVDTVSVGHSHPQNYPSQVPRSKTPLATGLSCEREEREGKTLGAISAVEFTQQDPRSSPSIQNLKWRSNQCYLKTISCIL